MGGKIWAESTLGKGSTFHFIIFAEALPDESKELIEPNLKGKRILIVENNKTNRRILAYQAKDWGMMPTTAASSHNVLNLVRDEGSFDIAIIENDLEEVNGAELAEKIRQYNKTMPLISLTSIGRSTESDLFAGTLTKPLKPAQIHKTLAEILSPQLVPSIARTSGAGSPSGTFRILLAEDNRSNQKVTMQMLKKLGYNSDVVSNGREVLAALERQRYGLILMDVRMPEMNGLEATRIIRQRWPDKGPLIIAVTAYGLQGDRERCMEAGMDDYLSKPVQLDDLARMLRKYSPVESSKKVPPKGRRKRIISK